MRVCFILSILYFAYAEAADPANRQEELNCCRDRDRRQAETLKEIVDIERDPDSVLRRAYVRLQTEKDETYRGFVGIEIDRVFSKVHKDYSDFVNYVRQGAAGHLGIDEKIKDIVECNLEILEDMKSHPNAYNLLETTLHSVPIEGLCVYSSFPKLKVTRK